MLVKVMAFSTHARPAWRWRIVDHAGAVVEESREGFGSIADAVEGGSRRVRELAPRDLTEGAGPRE